MLELTILFDVELGHFDRDKNESSINDSEKDDGFEYYPPKFV